MPEINERIETLLNTAFEGTSCFLVEIVVATNNTKVQVFVDCDKNITIDRCAELSRMLEKHLEEEGYVPEKYTLEVSSPGMSKPFRVMRQFEKNIGKSVIIQFLDGTKKEGLLLSVTDELLHLEEHIPQKRGKLLVAPKIQKLSIDRSLIKHTKKKISFKAKK